MVFNEKHTRHVMLEYRRHSAGIRKEVRQFKRHKKMWGFVGSLCSNFSYASVQSNLKICVTEWMKGAEHSNEYANSIVLCRCRNVMPIWNLLNKTLCRCYSSKYSNSIIYLLFLVCLIAGGSRYQCSDYTWWLIHSFS